MNDGKKEEENKETDKQNTLFHGFK